MPPLVHEWLHPWLEGNVGESGKLIKGRIIKNERVRVENKWIIWHNKRVATLTSTF